MKKVFIYAEDCSRRLLDAQRINIYFTKNGYKVINTPKFANYIVYLGCGLFNEDTEYEFQKIKKLQKYGGELIIAGCLPDIETERLNKVFNGKIISTKKLDKIDSLFPNHKVKFRDIDDTNICYQNNFEFGTFGLYEAFRKIWLMNKIQVGINRHVLKYLLGEPAYSHLSKSNYHVRVSWGCSGNCTYCAGRKAVGPLQSKPLNLCLQEFRNGLKEGYKDYFISGEDPGSYGLDIGSNFPKLLDEITKIPGEYTINIRGINPRWAVKYIDDLEKILKRHRIKSLGVPIQSGSARILKLMNRFSDIEKMKDACIRLKKSDPNLSLNTEIILGFPTETDEDFKQSLNFVKEVNFVSGRINRFSCKTGTKVESISPKVSQKEMSKRFKFARKYLKNEGYKVLQPTIQYCAFYKHHV